MVRDTLALIVVGTLGAHVMTEFPSKSVDHWSAEALSAYARRSTGEGLVRIARGLKETWLHDAREVARVLTKQARSPAGLTAEQRAELLEVARSLDPQGVP
jgi:hypothetical protein